MPKIFTIGFSGKSPDAFLEVLNAVRVSTVWDIRLWRTGTYVPFYSGDSLAAALGDTTDAAVRVYAHLTADPVRESIQKATDTILGYADI